MPRFARRVSMSMVDDLRRRLIATALVLVVGGVVIVNAAWWVFAYLASTLALGWIVTHNLGKAKPKDKK